MFLRQPQTIPKAQIEPQSQPWVEKYRPKTIDDVSSQEHTIAVLRKTLTSSNLPHMLFYGPPGTGKTSTILALARQLYGPDNFKSRVLELNASDERGITIVREKIKAFARQTPRAITVSSDGQSYPYPPYKIIILDEADSMTQDAQAALRRIMENYARITRFCLVCNYVTRIIEPLASRCSKFRFTPLRDDSTRSRLEYIASQESIPITPDVISTLIQVSGGDLRKSITYLQSAHRLSLAPPSLPITTRDIEEIAGTVPGDIVKSFAQRLGIDVVNETRMDMDNLQHARSLEEVRTEVRSLIRQAWGIGQLLLQLHDVIILHPTLTSLQKSKCAFAFAEADKALGDGGDEELWLLEVAVRIWKAVCCT